MLLLVGLGVVVAVCLMLLFVNYCLFVVVVDCFIVCLLLFYVIVDAVVAVVVYTSCAKALARRDM